MRILYVVRGRLSMTLELVLGDSGFVQGKNPAKGLNSTVKARFAPLPSICNILLLFNFNRLANMSANLILLCFYIFSLTKGFRRAKIKLEKI